MISQNQGGYCFPFLVIFAALVGESLGKHVLIRVYWCSSVVKTPAALLELGLARVMLTNR